MDFNASSPYCTKILAPYVQNLTSSYADKSNESSIVATSVVMFLLAALFFILNLFSRFSDISAILNPSVRLFLTASLSLFLPVMSYLFSEAKNEGATANGSGQPKTELSLRARTILMWMLLVELLRKKVEAILVNVGVQWYSGTIDRASRIAWLGYLVFFNLRSTGKKAVFGTLWVLAAAKLVQRVAINEILNRSFAYGKNAQLLNSYMAQMLHEQDVQQEDVGPDGSELLMRCKYAVMGEDNLEKEAGPEGYHLELSKVAEDATAVVTVGKIWVLAENDRLLQRDHRLKRLCLSFALYKLLRRRFEDLPITGAEARNCRDLIFRGLCKEGTDREAVAVALFQVFNDEIQFLCEYYHSVLPVVLSNPFFFMANYIMFPITVWAFCVLTVILCSNGDLLYAYGSIQSDNYAISAGIMRMTGCLLRIILSSPSALFSTVDLAVTILLGLTFLYEQVWEFLVFILSNWLMVSLLRHYTAKPRWRQSPIFSGIISRLLWVRNVMSHPNLCFKQFSVMKPLQGRVPLTLPTKAVPKEAKLSIMEYLLTYRQIDGRAAEPLSNGWSALERHPEYHSELSWACQSDSVADVILTWHIATCLLEVKYPLQKGTTSGSSGRKVATSLSKYCAYLVAFYPELLPDDREGTERVYKNMKTGLMEAGTLGCWGYYFLPEGTRCEKVLAVEARPVEAHQELAAMPVVWKGARLGKILLDKAATGNEEQVWKVLADLWTELIVYTAPSSGEVHVKMHKEALALGGEFITVLWALATHTGVARPAVKPWDVIPVQHVEGTASVPSACV